MRAQKKPFVFPQSAPAPDSVVLTEAAYFRMKAKILEIQHEERRLLESLKEAMIAAGLDHAKDYTLTDATLTATVVPR